MALPCAIVVMRGTHSRAHRHRTYRIVTREGAELATLQAASLAEVLATSAASLAPLEARIVSADGSESRRTTADALAHDLDIAAASLTRAG
jgi:hypothetical protein